MDWRALLTKAQKAGEQAAFEWWTSDASDGPVNPAGFVHVELTDPDQAAAVIALGDAVAVEGGARLARSWEHDGDRLEYARSYARVFCKMLADEGVPTRTVETFASDELDTGSLERGLGQLMHLGRIAVSDFIEDRAVIVTRNADGPYVLEVSAEQAAREGTKAFLADLEERGLPVRARKDDKRVRLGTDAEEAMAVIIEAIQRIEDSPTRTLVARYAPGRARTWKD